MLFIIKNGEVTDVLARPLIDFRLTKNIHRKPAIMLQETHRDMRISERDVTHIVLSVYLLTLTNRYPLKRKCPITHKMDHIP